MAASSSRLQLQKAVAILKHYLSFERPSSTNFAHKLIPKISSNNSAEEALEAIDKYVQHLGSTTASNSHKDVERNSHTSDAIVITSKINSLKQSDHSRSSSVPASSRRPIKKFSAISHSRPQSPSKIPLEVPPPTYSTMSIPVVGSMRHSNIECSHTPKEGAKSHKSLVPARQKEIKSQRKNTVNSYIPVSFPNVSLNFLSSNKQAPNDNKESSKPKWLEQKKEVLSKSTIDSRTRHLIRGINCDNEGATYRRLRDLVEHLNKYPQTKGTAVKSGGLGRLLRLVSTCSANKEIVHEANNALGLMGYPGPVSARGTRILTIDGGGVRGLVAIELVRKLEEKTGKPVHELFDFICGVSTGAIVAVLVGIHRKPPDECVKLYRQLSEKIFTQTPLKGATSLVMNSSYYDSEEWNRILQQNMGDVPLLDTASGALSPKLCLVASQAIGSETHAFLFRNYVLPYRVASHYRGTSRAKLWEGVRASAAAPGYFSEYTLGDKVLQDGGILVNNPTAIAVHEARQLWPDSPFQCVVSLGTGRCQPIGKDTSSSLNWSVKLKSVINSATDTEGIHTVLHDLLPGTVYYRFNPNLSDDYSLDEIKADRLATLVDDTNLYIRRNNSKFEAAAAALLREKTPYDKAKDFLLYTKTLHGWQ